MAETEFGNARILVVDDNPGNLGVLFDCLTREGFKVLVSQRGADAIDVARESHPDIVLLDILMPEMDGFEACRRLKKDEATREIPVVFISSLSDVGDKIGGFEAGGLDFISKPFHAEEVLARVNTQLRLRNLRRDLERQNARLQEEIAERTRMAEEIQKARESAESANQAKNKFLAAMSHELRTPMNTILGMTDLTLQSELSGEQRANVLEIRDSASHLLDLVNEILDFSEMETGKIEIERVDFDLSALVAAVVGHFREQASAKSLYLRAEGGADMNSRICGDSEKLKRVLFHLVGNALKFTRSGGITLKCWFSENGASHGGSMLSFSVSDTGIGVSEDKRSSIFDIFSQGNSSLNDRFQGTGIGLCLCRKLVESLGGTIRFESEPGQGSVFQFSVPCEKPAALLDPSARGISWRVLIAEDHPVNARIAQKFLERLGHRSATAVNGREALEILKRESFDLVLMDIEMPEMDGLEATRRIRQGEAGSQNARIPIVAMTAHALLEFREKCESLGMADFVAKPVDFKDLGALLKKAMARRG